MMIVKLGIENAKIYVWKFTLILKKAIYFKNLVHLRSKERVV
jgi:hypothetical protein